jgi:hypothetical protein
MSAKKWKGHSLIDLFLTYRKRNMTSLSNFNLPIGTSTSVDSIMKNSGKLEHIGNFLPVYQEKISTWSIEIIQDKT